MIKNNIVIVLVRPQMPENIGMVARGMMNFDFEKLRIVNPREKWPNKIANQTSVKASYIIKNTEIFSNLSEAISDLHYVIATSVRKRSSKKNHIYDFNSLISIIPRNKKIGVIFGPENSGLTNEEVSKCNCIFSFETNKNTSLNLSHAVTLFCYEYKKFQFKNKKTTTLNFNNMASKKEFEEMFADLENKLKINGFLKPPEKEKNMILNIRNMFIRANFSSQEIRTFRGIISSLNKKKISNN